MKPSPRNITAFSLGPVFQHILHLKMGPLLDWLTRGGGRVANWPAAVNHGW